MKRILATLLTLVLLTGAMVAPALAEGEVTLTLALLGDGQLKAKIDELLKKYTDETGVKVESLYIPGGWGEYCTKIQTMVAGGDPLDLANVAIEGVQMFVDMGIPAPIDDYIAANPDVAGAIQGDISDDLKEAFVFDGQTYAFPFSWNNVVMHFNTKLLQEAGVELPKDGWSKEDLLSICEKLTKEEDGVKQYAIAVPSGEYFCMEAWLYNNGASYMTEDFTKSTINSPESVEIFQLWQDLIYKYGYAPIPEVNVNPIQQLINDQVVMGSWGRWPTASYVNSEFKDVAIAYLPSFKTNVPIFGVNGMFVMKTSKHQDEAKKLAAWLSSAEFAGEYLTSSAIPALKTLAKEKLSQVGIPENYELFYEGTHQMKPVSAPIQFSEVSAIVLRAMSEICVNQADVQTTLDACAAEMDQALQGM